MGLWWVVGGCVESLIESRDMNLWFVWLVVWMLFVSDFVVLVDLTVVAAVQLLGVDLAFVERRISKTWNLLKHCRNAASCDAFCHTYYTNPWCILPHNAQQTGNFGINAFCLPPPLAG